MPGLLRHGAALAALGLGAILAAPPAAALVITPTFTSSVTTSPDAAAVEADFGVIVAQYEAMFTNPITVTLQVELQAAGPDGFLGENITNSFNTTYSAFVAALGTVSGGDPAVQSLLKSLPTGSVSPVDGITQMKVQVPDAVALGLDNHPSAPEATLIINSTGDIQFTHVDGEVGLNNYNFFSVAEHELDEVLGFGSALAGCGKSSRIDW